MSALALTLLEPRDRLGLKGPRAADWLVAQAIALPASPNTWALSGATLAAAEVLVARLGQLEFFLEDGANGTTLKRISPLLNEHPPGVYPVLREDWAFHLGGEQVHGVLAQVCNVNFAALPLASNPLIMTLMIGVAVLVVPQNNLAVQGGVGSQGGADTRGGVDAQGRAAGRLDPAERHYRIWCDPTFGPYLGESLRAVVIECGGSYTGVSDESANGKKIL
jgi:sarcosine oxidase subunit gamma